MTEQILTPPELAKRFDCSVDVIKRLVRSHRLPAFWVGRRQFRVKSNTVEGCNSLAELERRFLEPTTYIITGASAIATLIEDGIAGHPRDGGFVYFIRCQDIVKIGYSRDPSRRMRELQSVIPFELEMLGYLTASAKAERALHVSFHPVKHSLLEEWFNLSPDLRAAIEVLVEREAAGHA